MVMLGFRLREGLDLDAIASEYGARAASTIAKGAEEGIRRGWVVLQDENGSDGGDGVDRSSSPCMNAGVDGHDCAVKGVESTINSTINSTEMRNGIHKVPVEGSGSGRGSSEGESIETSLGSLNRRGRLRLSDPDGFLFSNSVISSVFCELDGWKRSSGSEEN